MLITWKYFVGISSNLLHSISTSICIRKCNKNFSWFRSHFLEKSMGSEITKNFYYIFLYLCCVASLSWFRLQFFELRSFFKMSQNLQKSLYYSTGIFPKNGSEITKIFYYIFLYILMYWCCVASLSWFRLQFFELRSFLKMSQNLQKSLTIAHGFFQKMAPKSRKIFITFSYTYWCTDAV